MPDTNDYPSRYLPAAEVADDLAAIVGLLRQLPDDVRLPAPSVSFYLAYYDGAAEPLRLQVAAAVAQLLDVTATEKPNSMGVLEYEVEREWPAARLRLVAWLKRELCGCGKTCNHHAEPAVPLRAVA